tara:strand:+ start:22 stop:519 length:498 start_codon:yes stop_codon:yes gene_type:complete
MATIPTGQQFHTLAADVSTTNRGSATANADRTIYKMSDIIDTVTGSVGDIGGSISENEIAIGAATSNEIGGSASLTYNGSLLTVSGAVSSGTLTATTDIETPTISITGGVVGSLRSAFVASAPTDAATAGTQGDILFDADAIYVCTVTGDAGAATWKRVVLVDLA